MTLLVQSNDARLAAEVDSLIADETPMESLHAQLIKLEKWRKHPRKPWDRLRWVNRVQRAEGRIHFRIAHLLLGTEKRMEEEAAAARAVDLDGSADTYLLLSSILRDEEYPSEALGTLLTGWLLTGNNDLLTSAKELYLAQEYPEEQWDAYRRQYQKSSVELILRNAERHASSTERISVPRSCRPKGQTDERVGVVVLWDEVGGDDEASILRELDLYFLSSGIPHSFCFAGINVDAGRAAALDWGLDITVKKIGFRSGRLLGLGIRSLPAVIVIRGDSPPLLLADATRLLPGLVEKVLLAAQSNRPNPVSKETEDE
ncbi:MAG: hypothetical protein V2A56_12870 [bacterium]